MTFSLENSPTILNNGGVINSIISISREDLLRSPFVEGVAQRLQAAFKKLPGMSGRSRF